MSPGQNCILQKPHLQTDSFRPSDCRAVDPMLLQECLTPDVLSCLAFHATLGISATSDIRREYRQACSSESAAHIQLMGEDMYAFIHILLDVKGSANLEGMAAHAGGHHAYWMQPLHPHLRMGTHLIWMQQPYCLPNMWTSRSRYGQRCSASSRK